MPDNSSLSIDAQKGEFHLAALKGADKPDEVKKLKELIESRLPRTVNFGGSMWLDHNQSLQFDAIFHRKLAY